MSIKHRRRPRRQGGSSFKKWRNWLQPTAALLLPIVVIFGLGILWTARTTKLQALGPQIFEAQKSIDRIEAANQKLAMDISRLESLDRIEAVAARQLAMRRPTVDDVKIVKDGGFVLSVRVDEAPPLATATTTPDIWRQKPLLAQVFQTVAGVFSPAQASEGQK